MRSALVLGLVIGLAGCGGAAETDLYGNPGTSGSDSGKDTSTGPDASTGNDGDIPIGDSSVNDVITIADATPIFDVTPIPDSGPADPGTLCFTQYNPPISTYCKSGTEICCIKQNASTCVSASSSLGCTQPATRMGCDDSADCPVNNVCCGAINSFNGNTYYSEIKCAATCAVNTQIPGYRRFCDPKASVDECAGIGLKCNPSNVLQGYYVCN